MDNISINTIALSVKYLDGSIDSSPLEKWRQFYSLGLLCEGVYRGDIDFQDYVHDGARYTKLNVDPQNALVDMSDFFISNYRQYLSTAQDKTLEIAIGGFEGDFVSFFNSHLRDLEERGQCEVQREKFLLFWSFLHGSLINPKDLYMNIQSELLNFSKRGDSQLPKQALVFIYASAHLESFLDESSFNYYVERIIKIKYVESIADVFKTYIGKSPSSYESDTRERLWLGQNLNN